MILITGATGIVGSHILFELLSQGHSVRLLLRENSHRAAIEEVISNNEDKLEIYNGDILDLVSLHNAVRGCDQVYHCAAMVSFDQKKAIEMHRVNVQGTANVVNVCLNQGAEKLCYISSTAAIGDEHINNEVSEESKWTSDKGRSAYSLSKRSAEFEVERGRAEGLNVVIVNPGIVIGPGKWGQSSTTLITSCERGMRLYPPGGNGFVSAADVAKFSCESMSKRRFMGRYLLVAENKSFKQLFEYVTGRFGSAKPILKVPKSVLTAVQAMLLFVESIGLNIFSISSENIASAKRNVRYNNKRALDTGFAFESIEEAVNVTVDKYLA